jgi:hypothetical protein
MLALAPTVDACGFHAHFVFMRWAWSHAAFMLVTPFSPARA